LSVLDRKDVLFSSSDAGIRAISKKPISDIAVSSIYSVLKKELEEIGFTITFRYGIYKRDGNVNINFTVRKMEESL
jgi:ferredoxin-fold anticodon binding domain-containing protein